MIKARDIYFCSICKNLIEVLSAGAPALVCCGEDMELVQAQTKDSTVEKHVPFMQDFEDGVKITVGEKEAHPMTDKHFIEFIEIRTATKVGRAELKPGDAPEATFNIASDEITEIYEYCNIHGLWKK